MKFLSILTLALLPLATLRADSEGWTVVLLQRQIETGATHFTPVAEEGRRASLAPVPEGGSEFELWALNPEVSDHAETLVDTEVVSAYLPDGELSITTQDPHVGEMPRTRIDKGFTLHYTIQGLLPEQPDAPLAAKQVLLDHNVASYGEGFIKGEESYVGPGEGLVGAVADTISSVLISLLGSEQDFGQQLIEKNGSDTKFFEVANIPGGNVFADAGIETFRLYGMPDGEVGQNLLSTAKVRVWPMAQATILGVSNNEHYSVIPHVQIDLKSLYPKSDTWVRIFKGGPDDAPGSPNGGRKLSESFVIVDDAVPRSTSLVFRDLNRVFKSEGLWTMEVLTETPFGVESLATKSLNVGRNLELRGSFQSLGNE
jgi:hypothetical protein